MILLKIAVQFFKDLWRGVPLGAIARSPKWSEVQKAHLKLFPACAVCNKQSTLLSPVNVHHKIPFHIDKSKELLEENLITLCRIHHFWWGHLGSWKSYNKDVKIDASIWKEKIRNRP